MALKTRQTTCIDPARHPSLQAAFDALPESEGRVRLPPGRFEIVQPLILSRGADVTAERVRVAGNLVYPLGDPQDSTGIRWAPTKLSTVPNPSTKGFGKDADKRNCRINPPWVNLPLNPVQGKLRVRGYFDGSGNSPVGFQNATPPSFRFWHQKPDRIITE